ncbi:MAG: hotdog fold thioesterase [Archaeoglobaceae archaeon]
MEVADYMFRNDKLFELFGVEILEVREGYAKVRMVVEERHLNAANVCHGGVIFSLADLAFALASNSHGKLALALDVSISYLKAALPGDELTAEAREVYLGKRTAAYIMEVRRGRELIAVAKGRVYRTDSYFPSSPPK